MMNEIQTKPLVDDPNESKGNLEQGFKTIEPKSDITMNQIPGILKNMIFQESNSECSASDFLGEDAKLEDFDDVGSNQENNNVESGSDISLSQIPGILKDMIFSKDNSEFSASDFLGEDTKLQGTDNLSSNQDNIDQVGNYEKDFDAQEKDSLTDEERAKIIEETDWSNEIIDKIDSLDQYEIYRDADLQEKEINGRKCLVKDIDLEYVDEKTGMTNKELMEKGRSPKDSKTGDTIELHHMGQSFNSPFAELTAGEHGGKNHGILHDNGVESWRQDPEKKNQYQNQERPAHWQTRASEEFYNE